MDKFQNVSVVDISSSFIKESGSNLEFLIIRDNNILYYDDDHLSYQGTQLVKSKLMQRMNNIIK